MKRRLAPLPPIPDLDTATADEIIAWARELKAQIDRELKVNKCSRPSCQRQRTPGATHCCENCKLDVPHAPECEP